MKMRETGQMASFSIGNQRVGDDAPVYIVAELSANHGNSLERAIRSVEAAAKAGANAIKLQTYTPDTITLRSSAPPFVVKSKNEWSGRTLHDFYAEAMTPWEWHKPLMDAATSFGMACFSTPFDATAVQFLADLNVPAWKIASFELVDLPLIEMVARKKQPMIFIFVDGHGVPRRHRSRRADLLRRGEPRHRFAPLRLVVPGRSEDDGSSKPRNAAGVRSRPRTLSCHHTTDNVTAIAAVSMGARFIEKHFIFDRSWGGPDAFFSLDPAQFKRLVDDVRVCEKTLGRPRFGTLPHEVASLAFRRSLFVARDVPAGATLTAADVRSVRPANGLPARHLPEVLGRTAQRALTAAEPLAWDMVGPTPSGPEVKLRAATLEDAETLRQWRNEAATQANSRQKHDISVNEHGQWLAAVLETDPNASPLDCRA